MSGHENPHAGQGAVLLDIGESVGALVITMPESLAGTEIEARPVRDHERHRPHVEVLLRPTPTGNVCAAVFAELAEGTYELYERSTGLIRFHVTVAAGEVTHAAWPAT